jgi:hypothetical protein
MTRSDIVIETSRALNAIEKSSMHPDIKKGLQDYISKTSNILDNLWDIGVDLEKEVLRINTELKEEYIPEVSKFSLVIQELTLTKYAHWILDTLEPHCADYLKKLIEDSKD